MISRSERQKLGVQKWISQKCRGTLQYATGVGKTKTALIAIKVFLSKNIDKKIVVIVPTEYLKTQWMISLNKENLIYNVSVEIINSAITSNSSIDFIILDECHRYAADEFYKIFNQRNPKIVLGLSATFDRLDGRHDLLNKYCPVCDIITVKEAIDNGWLSPYREYKVLLEVPDIDEYNKANLEFQNSFSFFDFDFKTALACLNNIIYRRAFAKKMGYSSKEIDAIVYTWHRALKDRKKFVSEHPKKIEIARLILNARKNSKAITFSATIKQAEKIGIGYVVHSGKTKRKNKIAIEEFSKLKTGVMNSSKSLDEGVDIPELNLAVILCNSSSKTQKTQRVKLSPSRLYN